MKYLNFQNEYVYGFVLPVTRLVKRKLRQIICK